MTDMVKTEPETEIQQRVLVSMNNIKSSIFHVNPQTSNVQIDSQWVGA